MKATLWRRRNVSARRPAEDEGFTLIEVTVALMLTTLVLAAFLAVTLGAMAASRFAESRSRANQLANEAIEQLKSESWPRLGLNPNDCGYPGVGTPHTDPAVSNEEVVDIAGAHQTGDPYPVLGGSCSASAGQAAPVRTNVAYTVTNHITWRDDPGDGLGAADTNYNGTHDVKHFVVVVTWKDRGQTRTLTQDALRSPTSTEVVPVKQTTACALCVTATATGDQTLTTGGALTAAITLSATTSAAATGVTVTYPKTSGTGSVALTGDGTSTGWTGSIPTGTCCFNAGTLKLTFTASQGATTGGASATVALTSGTAANFGLSGSVAPNSLSLDSTGHTTAAYTLNATTTTAVASVFATITRDGASVDINLPSSNAGKTWTLVVPSGNGVYATGVMTVTYTAQNAGGAQTVTTSITFTPPPQPRTITSVVLLNASNATTSFFCTNNSNNKIVTARTVRVYVQNGLSTDQVNLTWSNWTNGTASGVATYQSTDASGIARYDITFTPGGSGPRIAATSTALTVQSNAADGSVAAPDSNGSYTVTPGCNT